MKLSQDTLPQFFSIADSTNSWCQSPTNTFDFVDRKSKTLVVTIGDSWTWGADLSIGNNDLYRRTHVYGNLVSQKLNADWLNLALCAQGNFWIATMVQELTQVIPRLLYQHVYVICTFTGVLRWFNTRYDVHLDYIKWFKENAPNFDRLPVMLNQYCVRQIVESLSGLDHVVLKVGTGFVDHIGFDALSANQILPDPWYKLIGCSDCQPVYTCVNYETISQAIEFIDPKYHLDFKKWLLEIIDKSQRRQSLINDPAHFRNYHPLAHCHDIWARYITKQITK